MFKIIIFGFDKSEYFGTQNFQCLFEIDHQENYIGYFGLPEKAYSAFEVNGLYGAGGYIDEQEESIKIGYFQDRETMEEGFEISLVSLSNFRLRMKSHT